MTNELSGKTIAFLVTDGFEQVEMTSPWEAVTGAGATPKLVALQEGEVRGFHDDTESGDTFTVDGTAEGAHASDYDALVLPGGVVNADSLRIDAEAQRFTREFFDARKPVAAICHAPWLLIEVNAVANRTMTSYKTLETDLRNAGAQWVDTEVVLDDGLVTSRSPADLDALNATVIEEFGKAAQAI